LIATYKATYKEQSLSSQKLTLALPKIICWKTADR